MKKISLLIVLAIIGFSCREEFTEEDALRAQQEIDLAIYLVDLSDATNPPISNATVIISQGDQTFSATTNENGIAQYENVKVGDFVYSITAENYVSISGTGEIDPQSFRISQEVVQVGTYALNNSTNLATLKGRITIDTDVTNSTRENAVDVPIYISATVSGSTFNFSTTTDAQGLYEIQLPVIEGASQYRVSVPDLELDQTIALNRYADETGSFFGSPQILPRVEQIPTVFSIFRTGLDPSKKTIPLDVRSIYALADDAPTGGTTAIISSVSTNTLGEVTGLTFFNGGDYTGDADGTVRIEVFGLGSGSGAVFDVPLNTATNLQTAWFNATSSGAVTLPAGSGYFANSFGSNIHLNQTFQRDGSVDGLVLFSGNYISIQLQESAIIYLQMDYGTGIARERELQ